MKSLQSITQIDADHLLDRVFELATDDRKEPVSIAVVDVHGHPLQAFRMNGASADSFWIALAKAETAVRGGKDTVEIAYEKDPKNRWRPKPASEHRADDNRRVVNAHFVSWAGGVLLRVEGDVVGAVAVSGRSELEDHLLISTIRDRWESTNEAHSTA